MTTDNFESVEQQVDELLSSHLFDCIPDPCVIFDKQFYIVKINSKADQMFLFPKEYMMSKPFWEVAPQYINTSLFHNMCKIVQDRKEITLEVRGSITNRWFKVTLRMISNYIGVFFSDITQYKHTQNELLRAEERFTAVFRNSHALMAIISLENNQFISVNDRYANFFEYTPVEIIGKTKDEIFTTLNSPLNQTQLQKNYQDNTMSELISVRTKTNTQKSCKCSVNPPSTSKTQLKRPESIRPF